MMMVKTVLVVVAALVAGLLETSRAASVPDAKMQSCLSEVEEKITEVEIPDEIRNFGSALKSLNPNLKSLSLNRMLDNESANLDVVGEGIVALDQIESLLDECELYAFDLGPILTGSACGDRLVEQLESEVPDGYENLDERIGHVKVCLGKVIKASPMVLSWLNERPESNAVNDVQ